MKTFTREKYPFFCLFLLEKYVVEKSSNQVEIYCWLEHPAIKMAWDIPVFTRLNWGNESINITPQTLTPPSRVGSGLCTQATRQAPSSSTHTLHLYAGRAGSSPAQPLCWSVAKNIPAPQALLCAFTESHCVAHSNTCTYFSMVSLDGTSRSLSVQMSSCCWSLSREISEHERELSMLTQTSDWCDSAAVTWF